MNKKSGTAGTPVTPLEVTPPTEAATAQVGAVSSASATALQRAAATWGGVKVGASSPTTESSRSSSSSSSSSSSAAGGSNATSSSSTPHRPPENQQEREERPSWIEIELVGEDNQPVPGERYRVKLPDGSVDEGVLDQKGFARIEGFLPGACEISFPDLDQDAWEDA